MRHNNHFNILTRFTQKSVLLTTLVCASASVFALQSDRNQSVELLADSATFNDKTGLMTYSGNVVIEQGTMKLQASSVVAQFNANRQVRIVTATGSPAKFQQQMDGNKGLARGEAQKIIYNTETGILNMSGNAYLDQNGASIRSNTLKYSMNKGDVEASGGGGSGQNNGGRVKIVIPPSTNKTFPGARD